MSKEQKNNNTHKCKDVELLSASWNLLFLILFFPSSLPFHLFIFIFLFFCLLPFSSAFSAVNHFIICRWQSHISSLFYSALLSVSLFVINRDWGRIQFINMSRGTTIWGNTVVKIISRIIEESVQTWQTRQGMINKTVQSQNQGKNSQRLGESSKKPWKQRGSNPISFNKALQAWSQNVYECRSIYSAACVRSRVCSGGVVNCRCWNLSDREVYEI